MIPEPLDLPELDKGGLSYVCDDPNQVIQDTYKEYDIETGEPVIRDKYGDIIEP